MALFEKKKPLIDASREHLELCGRLAESDLSHGECMEAAMRAINVDDVRRAAQGEEGTAEFLYAPLEVMLRRESVGPYVQYLFCLSIFLVAVENEIIDGPLTYMTGSEAASHLEHLLLMAMDSDDDDFILGPAGDTLDHLGDMLDKALCRIKVRAFRFSVLRRRSGTGSKLEQLTAAADAETLRTEAAVLLPLARQQCAGDEASLGLLNTIARMMELADVTEESDEGEPAEPLPQAVLSRTPLDGREVSMSVIGAFQRAVSRLAPGEPVDTRLLFIALEDSDMQGEWDRLWLHAGNTDFRASLTLPDPEPDSYGSWNGIPLTATCTRSMQVAVTLCDAYNLWPMPIGAAAIGLIADPESGASRALMFGGDLDHAAAIALLQDIAFNGRLSDLEPLLAAAIPRAE
jgi:hypothetical protein